MNGGTVVAGPFLPTDLSHPFESREAPAARLVGREQQARFDQNPIEPSDAPGERLVQPETHLRELPAAPGVLAKEPADPDRIAAGAPGKALPDSVKAQLLARQAQQEG